MENIILGSLFAVIGGIISYIIRRINKLGEEMAKHRQDVNNAVMSLTQQVNDAILRSVNETLEMKTNYLDRFKELKEHGNRNNADMKEYNNAQFSEVKVMIATLSSDLRNHIDQGK